MFVLAFRRREDAAYEYWSDALTAAYHSVWILLGGLLGAIAGSFLATLVIRWPTGASVARGRSRCDGCATTLHASELIPLVSWLVLRGGCRRCGAAINLRHPAMEAGGALIGMVSIWGSPGVEGLAGALFGWVLLTLAVLDFDHFWLPDRLTLPLGAAGLCGGLAGLEPLLADRMFGAAAGFASLALVAAVYRRMRGRIGLGGGDPKIFAAIGAWLGWRGLPLVLLTAAMIGLGILLWRMLRGARYDPTARLPLGSLLAAAAWPLWVGHTWARG